MAPEKPTLLAAAIALLAGALVAEASSDRVLVVPYEYQSLVEALEAAKPGDIVYLAPGNYSLDRVYRVDKPVYIIGAGPSLSRLTAPPGCGGEGVGIVFTNGSSVIAGLSIQGSRACSITLRVEKAGLTVYRVELSGSVSLHAGRASSLVVSGARGYTRETFVEASGALSIVVHNTSLSLRGPLVVAADTGRVELRGVEAWGLLSGTARWLVYVSNTARLTITGSLLVSSLNGVLAERVANTTILGSTLACSNPSSPALALYSVSTAHLAQSLVVGGIELSSSKLGVYYTTQVAPVALYAEPGAGVSTVTGGGNIFYVASFCGRAASSSIRGSLDEAPELASYYSHLSPLLPDNMSGPAQDKPGPDGIGDHPVKLCSNITSKYPAKQPPQTAVSSCTTLPGASRVEDILPEVKVEDWTWIPIPLRNTVIRVEAKYSASSTGNPEALVGLCSGCLPGTGRLRVEAELVNSSLYVDVFLEGELFSSNTTVLGETVPGTHSLELSYRPAGSVSVSVDGFPLLAARTPPVANNVGLWLYTRGLRIRHVQVNGDWKPRVEPLTLRLPRLNISLSYHNVSITVPLVELTTKTIPVNMTITVTATRTVTVTATKTVSRVKTITRRVTSTATRLETVWKTATHTITVTSRLNETVTVAGRVEGGSARAALLLTLLGLIAALVTGRLLAR